MHMHVIYYIRPHPHSVRRRSVAAFCFPVGFKCTRLHRNNAAADAAAVAAVVVAVAVDFDNFILSIFLVRIQVQLHSQCTRTRYIHITYALFSVRLHCRVAIFIHCPSRIRAQYMYIRYVCVYTWASSSAQRLLQLPFSQCQLGNKSVYHGVTHRMRLCTTMHAAQYK